ncbi:amidohydrolase family protein [Nitrosomonas sp. sh817]|uniref:amidohydrolase family protein n=1 Tax=Nitrosomonas sp. sh817 TaxID=3070658 RepID=UPI0027DCB34B|nr:amidohydrolase family protein [Nitrosomonas sp. sh817]WMJ09749.1 amidohydrolase family protein [Nitrosomonas sp. sh817]
MMNTLQRNHSKSAQNVRGKNREQPVDPASGGKLALRGRIVTMNESFEVIADGVIYIEHGSIAAIAPVSAPMPAGFEGIPVIQSGGTIYPGLIELHNHLAYNALCLWDVPKQFSNRNQWSGIPEYRKLISGPMQIIGKSPQLVPALIRYVECKSLVGGVTTSQGIQLFSNAGIRRYYRGIVRNVEQTDEAALPEADTRIADVDAKDAQRFFSQLKKASCFLLHLSEGIDQAARKHFLSLQLPDEHWAITRQLAGIHCAGLTQADFGVYGRNGGAMIWSPLSNLLLYGKTADIAAAKAAGVRIGIGSDWSPSGSKNLLGELKVARLVSQASGAVFSDRDILAMATRNAAAILQWEDVLGSLEQGKRADLIVVSHQTDDPYANLLQAKETAIRLVMINGVPRYGLPGLMQSLGVAGETLRIGGLRRVIFLQQQTADPSMGSLTLKSAAALLRKALSRLPEIARELEQPAAAPRVMLAKLGNQLAQPQEWTIALDELEDSGMDLRPRLSLAGAVEPTGAVRGLERAAAPLSQIVQPLPLDPLTVAGDPDFLDRIANQKNLPGYVKTGLPTLY